MEASVCGHVVARVPPAPATTQTAGVGSHRHGNKSKGGDFACAELRGLSSERHRLPTKARRVSPIPPTTKLGAHARALTCSQPPLAPDGGGADDDDDGRRARPRDEAARSKLTDGRNEGRKLNKWSFGPGATGSCRAPRRGCGNRRSPPAARSPTKPPPTADEIWVHGEAPGRGGRRRGWAKRARGCRRG
ncbi:unnamed protein product [Lampetra planeri]